MTRLSVLALSLLIAAAPLSVANAQDRAGGDRGGRPERSAPPPERRVRTISPAEARAIAESQAPGARYMSYEVDELGNYRVRFERDGRVFYINVRS